jgi:ribosome-binding protein aMBF1 (putative translation factor)
MPLIYGPSLSRARVTRRSEAGSQRRPATGAGTALDRRLPQADRGRRILLAQARKQLGLAQRDIAATMGASIARISQIQHGEVISFEVIARYVEALGGRLDLAADFDDRAVRFTVSDTADSTAA